MGGFDSDVPLSGAARQLPPAVGAFEWTLFFDDFEEFHGTCLGADAASDALGSKFARLCLDHHAEGTCLDALAAAGAELLVDSVDALRVLRDGAGSEKTTPYLKKFCGSQPAKGHRRARRTYARPRPVYRGRERV